MKWPLICGCENSQRLGPEQYQKAVTEWMRWCDRASEFEDFRVCGTDEEAGLKEIQDEAEISIR
jgi:hypothetical protein